MCPSLPGCFSQGETEAETIASIKEAMMGFIEALEADGLPVPDDTCEIRVLSIRVEG